MTNEMSADAIAYYAGGFKRTFGGVPCKVFHRRTTDGRYVSAKDSPYYDALYDDPTHGISRLERDYDVIGQARLALEERTAPKPRKPRQKPASAQEPVATAVEPVEASYAPPAAPVAPVAASDDIAANLAALAARVDAMEAARQAVRPIVIAAPANDAGEVRPARTDGERRAILRAWRLRGISRHARSEQLAEREFAHKHANRACEAVAYATDMVRERDEARRLAEHAAKLQADAEMRTALIEAERDAAFQRADDADAAHLSAETALALANADVVRLSGDLEVAMDMATAAEAGAIVAATALPRMTGRADRMARIAIAQRRTIALATAQTARAIADAKLAQAGERKALKRLDTIRLAIEPAAPVSPRARLRVAA